jgi:hypothetical protein
MTGAQFEARRIVLWIGTEGDCGDADHHQSFALGIGADGLEWLCQLQHKDELR